MSENTPAKNTKQKYSILNGRSMCVHCKHVLSPLDLIPVFSWLGLRGRCRYCKEPISWQYPVVELVTTILFLASYFFWPVRLAGYQWIVFVSWLVTLVGLVAMAVYDLKWFILPDKLTAFVTALVGLQLSVGFVFFGQSGRDLIGAIVGGAICFGLFWTLFQVSGGKWIGGGDVKLVFVLGLLAGDAVRALLTIFLASLIGCFVALMVLPFKRLRLHSKLPFGPLLIAGTIIVYLFGAGMVAWYKQQIGY